MYSFGGRGGPRKSTPANVQCQKCLKRDKSRHYSYECKSNTQERPYASRPSRSQQLRNPKLVPKLTNESLEPVENKKGAADKELAKKEAERARKRDLDERDDKLLESVSKRRSVSPDSASIVSTRSSESPPRQQVRDRSSPSRSPSRSQSPPRRETSRSLSRSRSRSRSRSPPRRRRSPLVSRDSLSPRNREKVYRDRREEPARRYRDDPDENHSRSRSPEPRPSGTSRGSARENVTRPPERMAREGRSFGGPSRGRREGYHGDDRGPRDIEKRVEPTRQRSLSPFSKRLALTKGMNAQ